MQVSRPHCAEVLQVLPPAGMGRHSLARQNSPVWQSVFCAHEASQRLLTHDWPLEQSAVVEHRGRVWHVPALHPQLEWQSAVDVHAQPAQPKRHSAEPS